VYDFRDQTYTSITAKTRIGGLAAFAAKAKTAFAPAALRVA